MSSLTEKLSSRLEAITPSAIQVIAQTARELRSAGKDVIDLSIGEPGCNTPDHIKEAAKAAIDNNITKYTPANGVPDLRKAIQDKFKRENNLDYDLDEITVGVGAKQLLFNAILATIDQGDEVIIPAPYWPSYIDMTVLADGIAKTVICTCESNFKLTAKKLESAITANTKWLLLNSPSNPTGEVYSDSELKSLAKVLLQHPHVMIMSDDIYEHMIYGGSFHSILNVEPELKQRTLVINGVSKAYAMTGWRLGYAAGPKPIINAMNMLQQHSCSHPSSISQVAAAEALIGDQSTLLQRRTELVKKGQLMSKLLNNISGLNSPEPAGAFYLYVSCKHLIDRTTPDGKILQSDIDVAEYLLRSANVCTIPGTAFGLSPYLRISYDTSSDLIKQSASRIEKSIATLKTSPIKKLIK